MTPRQRMLAAINHEEPDRVPIVLGVSNATGIKAKPYRELKKLLAITAEERYLYEWPELGTVLPDEQTLVRLGSDVRGVFDVEPAHILERNAHRPDGAVMASTMSTPSRSSLQIRWGPRAWIPLWEPR